MAYQVFFTNSTPSSEFPDGHHRVFDGGITSATDKVVVPEGPAGVFELVSAGGEALLSLVGKYKLSYGNEVAQAFLHLLENFANAYPAAGMVHGQTWYADLTANDTTYIKNTLYLYKGLGPILGGSDPTINPADLYALLDKETPRTLEVVQPAAGLTISHTNYVLEPRIVDNAESTGISPRVETPTPGSNVNLNDGRGTISITLANDLAALEGLGSTGIAVRSAADTWVQRSVVGTSNRISLTNGSGVSGNPTVDIDAAYVGQASISTLGTVSVGTWQATTVGTTYGGTGLSSYTTGDVLYASATNVLAKLSAAGAGNVLISGPTPSWGKVSLDSLGGRTQAIIGNLSTNNLNSGTGATLNTFWRGDGTWSTPSVDSMVGVLPIANGGTNANNAVDARINLGLEIGVNVPSPTGTGASGTWAINVSGNAVTTTALQTPRNIGGVSFNGTADINLPGVNIAGNQNTSGNAATATALQTSRTIGLSGVTNTPQSFNGTANITIPVTDVPWSLVSGDTTVGSNFVTLTNPSAITYIRVNADNSVSTLDAATFKTSLGFVSGSDSGTVSSVAVTVPTGLSVSGSPITTSGTFAITYTAGYQGFLTTDKTKLDNATNVNTASTLVMRDGSGDFSANAITLGGPPSANLHAATKQYVDDVATGLLPKASVRVTTTANITLSGPQTIDGVSVVAGNRVLVKNQSTPSQNGIYIVAAGAWTRSADFDGTPSSEVASGAYIFVSEGSTLATTGWVLATSDPIIVGTTNLTFVQFSGGGTYTNGAGLTLTGNSFSLDQAFSPTWSGSHIFSNLITGSISGNAATVTTNANLTGDVTSVGNAATLATVNGNVGTFGSATSASQITVNGKGLITGASSVTITPAFASITGKPTTLTGYGITDAQPLSSNLTAYAGGDTPSAFVLGIVDAADALAFRTAIGASSGGVTSVGVSGSNGIGVSGSPITTAGVITLSLGAITPSSVAASGTVTGSNLSGSNTGDQTITLTGDVTGSGTGSFATTLASVISAGGPIGSSSVTPVITYDAKGRLTAVSSATITPAAIGAPTTTGSGASGTWAINVSGNAATATNADMTDGYHAAEAATGSTLAARTVSGYINAAYFNQSSPNGENPSVSQVYVDSGDGYHRKASIAHLTASLSGTAPINISGNAATATSAGSASTATTSTYSTYLWATTHVGSYYLQNAWDGSYWQVTNSHGAPVNVGRASALSSLGSTAGGSQYGVVLAVGTGDDPIKYTSTLTHRPSDGYTGTTYIGNTAITSYINLTTSGASWTDLTMVGPATGGYQGFRFATSGRLLMVASGATGFYTGSAWMHYHDGSTLQVTGAIVASGDITAFSDARLKENVETIESPLATVMKLRGVSFDWKDIEHNSTKRGKHAFGVIAQEVEEVLPFVVEENTSMKTADADSAETYKTVDYMKLVPLLLEAIKEQQKQIDELKAKVNL